MGGRLWGLVRLLRPEQWYKNLLALVPLVFVNGLLNAGYWEKSLIAVAALCALSSAGYAFNDIVDARRDRHNPEKRGRPLASGVLAPWHAAIVMVLCAALGIGLLVPLGLDALTAGAAVLGITTLYSIILKKEPFVDVLALSVNFVLRAAAGAAAIGVVVSPWLALCAFFLALQLSAGKRLAEMRLMGAQAGAHRPALAGYTTQNALLLMGIAASLLLMSYALYSFVKGPQLLMATLPFAFYGVLRHAALAAEGSSMARHPHKLFADWRMMVAALCWSLLTIAFLYL